MPLDPSKLRSARESRGLSQRALAETAGVSQPFVALLETGNRPDPQLSTLEKIAKVLRVPLSRLISNAT